MVGTCVGEHHQTVGGLQSNVSKEEITPTSTTLKEQAYASSKPNQNCRVSKIHSPTTGSVEIDDRESEIDDVGIGLRIVRTVLVGGVIPAA